MKMWIARDSGGALFLYPEKPVKDMQYGCWDCDDWYQLDKSFFPEVTFENSPMKVELVIKK